MDTLRVASHEEESLAEAIGFAESLTGEFAGQSKWSGSGYVFKPTAEEVARIIHAPPQSHPMSRTSPPFQLFLLLAGGMAMGMFSWLAALAVSGQFEPFDSGVGLLANQFVLSPRWPSSLPHATDHQHHSLFLCGAYVGMNAHSYGFGGSEKKAWAALGAVVRLSLLLVPAVLVTVITVIRRVRRGPPQRTEGGSRSGQP